MHTLIINSINYSTYIYTNLLHFKFFMMHKDVEINVAIIFLVKYPYMKNISIQQ